MTKYDAIDLFAGPGGWDEAAKLLGLTTLGFEFEKNACNTRRAAGHATIEGDLTTETPTDYQYTGLIASPPCQAFSKANKNAKGESDPRGALVREPLRWIKASNPEWVAFEQVPSVLPIWKEIEVELQALGYHTWVGVLNAADYGTPQARKRAVLIASKVKKVAEPAPTHKGQHVTVAQALPHRTDLPVWATQRAATTVVGSFRPEVIAAPGWRKPGDKPRQHTPDSFTVTQEEAGILQGFPATYPWQGAKTRQRQQVGNAIPVQLAAAILTEATR